MELWDAYDAEGRSVHQTLVRGEPVPAGLHHLVAEVLVRHQDGSWLVMQRDPHKELYPGLWEASAGGSALLGETVEQAARREVLEETGLTLCSLQPMYHEIGTSWGWILDYFLGEVDGPKTAVRFQPGETVGYRWVNTETLRVLIAARRVMHAGKLDAFFNTALLYPGRGQK